MGNCENGTVGVLEQLLAARPLPRVPPERRVEVRPPPPLRRHLPGLRLHHAEEAADRKEQFH